MHNELDSLQAELASKRLQQDRLQREVDRLKLTAETLAQKGTETQIAKSIDLGDTSVMVISEANIPTDPVKPNKKLNMAIAMLLGLMIFTLLAFILEYLDNTIKTPEDISRELALPVLGIIPLATSHNTIQHPYGGY
jgi:capsular polysaccharide biosynthesis protein